MLFSTCSDLHKYKALVVRCLCGTLWCAGSFEHVQRLFTRDVFLGCCPQHQSDQKFNTNFSIGLKLVILSFFLELKTWQGCGVDKAGYQCFSLAE